MVIIRHLGRTAYNEIPKPAVCLILFLFIETLLIEVWFYVKIFHAFFMETGFFLYKN